MKTVYEIIEEVQANQDYESFTYKLLEDDAEIDYILDDLLDLIDQAECDASP